jgi:magnesium chelatase family protein
MSFAKVHSAQTSLLKAHIIDIEVDISKGLHSFSVVGLPDKAVEESRDRFSAAIKNSGFKSPKNKNQKVVVSLAPADIKKEGPSFDLGMAVAYLLASEQISFDANKILFLGELSLDGKLRKISGVLPLVRGAKTKGFKSVFLPIENAEEGALISGIEIYGAQTLEDVLAHLDENREEGRRRKIVLQPLTKIQPESGEPPMNFKDVRGQESAKRGLEIAAAGGHNVALYGPPGTGKTMLARAFSGILPALSFEDILETTSIHSVAGTLGNSLIISPPFRSPHHTASYVSIVGGGTTPKPGEVTLAHRGVLFLDEFPEFERRVIDSLRQPLEDRVVSISRAKGSATFPANFILVAAMNPCPCGNYGFKGKECVCSPINLIRYQRKLSGPIMERIDIWLEVPRIEHEKLSLEKNEGEESKHIRKRVEAARKVQEKRLKKAGKKTNAEMSARDLVAVIKMDEEAKITLKNSAEHLNLSPRVYHKIIKVARTIADLEGVETISPNHILEAIQYRPRKQ